MTFGCSKQRVISSHGRVQNLLKRKSDDFVIMRLMHDPFLRWEKGRALGDDIIGPDNLRRYFEQRFHDQNDSFVVFFYKLLLQYCLILGQWNTPACLVEPRTYALCTQGVLCCQQGKRPSHQSPAMTWTHHFQLLQEAIAVARTCGDRITLQHCIRSDTINIS